MSHFSGPSVARLRANFSAIDSERALRVRRLIESGRTRMEMTVDQCRDAEMLAGVYFDDAKKMIQPLTQRIRAAH